MTTITHADTLDGLGELYEWFRETDLRLPERINLFGHLPSATGSAKLHQLQAMAEAGATISVQGERIYATIDFGVLRCSLSCKRWDFKQEPPYDRAQEVGS